MSPTIIAEIATKCGLDEKTVVGVVAEFALQLHRHALEYHSGNGDFIGEDLWYQVDPPGVFPFAWVLGVFRNTLRLGGWLCKRIPGASGHQLYALQRADEGLAIAAPFWKGPRLRQSRGKSVRRAPAGRRSGGVRDPSRPWQRENCWTNLGQRV